MLILQLWQQFAYDPARAAMIIVGVLVGIFGAITIHEFAHAWEATRLGDDTAKHMGRLTLNPLAHIDPLGLFLFVMAGFGFGKPVPYNARALRSDTDEIKIALAGPAANLILAFLLALPYRIATLSGVDISQSYFITFMDTLVYMNLVLAVFNIIPIPPLDGSKVLNYFLDDDARDSWARIGPILLMALIFSDLVLRGSGGLTILNRILTPLLHLASFLVRGTPQLF